MKKILIILLLLAVFLFSSCSLMRIRSGEIGDTKSVKGIPFYCKVNNLYQVTRWLQTCYLAVFYYKEANEKKWQFVQITVNEDQLSRIKEWFEKLPAQVPEKILEAAVAEFLQFLNVEQAGIELVYNNLEVKTEIDTSRVYYLNQQLPLIGSSSVEMELNPDGTLAKAKSSAETQTLSKVLDFVAAAFPFTAFFEKKLGLQPMGVWKEKLFDIKLSVTSKIFLYTLTQKMTKGEKAENGGAVPEALQLKPDGRGNLISEKSNVGFEKKEIKPDAEKKDEKVEKKAIEFSGQIALPVEKK